MAILSPDAVGDGHPELRPLFTSFVSTLFDGAVGDTEIEPADVKVFDLQHSRVVRHNFRVVRSAHRHLEHRQRFDVLGRRRPVLFVLHRQQQQ